MKGLIHSACSAKWYSMPKMMRQALNNGEWKIENGELAANGEENNSPLSILNSPLPKRLPALVKLLVSRTPDVYKPAVAHAVFPALGAHLHNTRFKYIDNVEHEATLMNVLMAGTGAGKDCISEPINRIMADIRRRDEDNLRREREWKNGDVIAITLDMSTYLIRGSSECSNPNGIYNVVVKRGPVVYARDYRLEGDGMFSPLVFAVNEDGTLNAETEDGEFPSQCQLSVGLADGTTVSLVDYGSAGKTMDDDSVMCLWIPTVDYWSVDLGGDVVLRAGRDGALMRFTDDGHMVALPSYGGVSDKSILATFAWKFEREGDYYRIKCLETGGYLTIRDDDRITYVKTEYDSRQLFSLKQCGLNKFKLVLRDGRVLSRYQDDDVIYVTDDISHENQYWYFESI